LSTEEITSDERPVSPSILVSVVGVGGAGNNLLSHAIGGGVSPSRCVAVNTDRAQLSRSQARNKVFLEQPDNLTTSPLTKREDQKTFQSAAHRVTSYTDSSDFTIVLTGLGGGTGTESAPMIAQKSRSPVRPVVSVVAIPFIHERERRFIALRGLKKMVDACDCTVVVDNGINRDYLRPSATRTPDETASVAVRSLTELLSGAEDIDARQILQILSKGDLATVSSFTLRAGDTLQSSVIQALRTPSANLPLRQAKGALLLYRGPATLSTAQFAHAYDALVSLVGNDIDFVHGSMYTPSDPSVCLFLTGYTYGSALEGFTEFVELYDAEYGEEEGEAVTSLSLPLYQMEEAQDQTRRDWRVSRIV
jgi:cell division protein FtsZ